MFIYNGVVVMVKCRAKQAEHLNERAVADPEEVVSNVVMWVSLSFLHKISPFPLIVLYNYAATFE